MGTPTALTMGLLSLGASAGTAAATGAFSRPDAPEQPDPRTAQRGTDPAVDERARAERRRRAMARGRESTMLTGTQDQRRVRGQGQNTGVGRKSLLGE